MQKGQIFRKSQSWFLRYWETQIENGALVRKRVCKRLAPFCDLYRSVASVRPLAQEILGPLNAGKLRPESTQTVADFIEHSYLPHCKEHKRPSTYRGYCHIFREHLQRHLNDIRLRDFRCAEGDRLLAIISEEAGLSHNSLRHLKSFLSGAFTVAKRKGILDGPNPMDGVSIPEGTPGRETHAYSLEEIQAMLRVLPEPARTVVATAAFTGLRRSELRGLRWEDFRGDELRVSRTVWYSHFSKPKTRASAAPVPMLPVLCHALVEHRKCNPGDGFIFAARNGSPKNLQNMARRVICPVLRKAKIAWHGWHAFRRGLATNLYRLGVSDKTIQAILRHANVNTTLTMYVKSVPADSHAAMQRLERALGNNWATPKVSGLPN